MEEHGRSRAAGRSDFLDWRDGLALVEALLPRRAVTLHRGHELLRERVDDARADAVQAACGLVVAGLEFRAGMEDREDDLECVLAGLRVPVHGDPAPIVGDRQRRAAGVQGHDDRRRVAVHGFVDRVVEDLPREVMEAGRADAPDVHPRPLADRVEAFENGDVFCGVGRCHQRGRVARAWRQAQRGRHGQLRASPVRPRRRTRDRGTGEGRALI